MNTTKLAVAALALGTLIGGIAQSTAPQSQEVAARYHLRQRTQRFFERATPAGRAAQQGIYQSLPKPAEQRPTPA